MSEIIPFEPDKPCPYCGAEVIDVPGIGLECLGGWECPRPTAWREHKKRKKTGLAAAAEQWERVVTTPLWELEDFPSAGHLLTLATEFRIAPYLHVYRRLGDDDWVITNGTSLRNHDGRWEVPNTTDEYIARTTYKFIDAMQIAIMLPVTEPNEGIRRGFFPYPYEVPPRKEA